VIAFKLIAMTLAACISAGACTTNPDHLPLRSAHRYHAVYKPLEGPLFAASGPSPYDVRQGEAGSCWLLSAMAAVASQRPEMIRAMFEPVSPDRYRVRFHSSSAEGVEVRVTTEVPYAWFSSQPLYAASHRGTWVSVLEKAYAQAFFPAEGYEGIGGDHPRLALERLTGWPVRDYDIDGDLSKPGLEQEWKHLFAAYRRGAPMVAGSRILQLRADILPMHAYAVTGMQEQPSGVRLLRLFDPEGLNAYPNSELVLRLDELDDFFYYVSIAEPTG
jgi:hypothetical protein